MTALMPRPTRPLRLAALAAALSIAATAHAQDSGLGIDLQFGNALDTNGMGSFGCEKDGMSWLHAGSRRTPTGFLSPCAVDWPTFKPTSGDEWSYEGSVGLGYMSLSGDAAATQWRRFNDFDNGVLFDGRLRMQRTVDGSYFDFRASRINEHNQFYRAVFGRAGKYRVQAFIRSTPNVTSGNARSIWDGVGGQHLTLKDGLTPAASTPTEVAAVSAAQPESILRVVRDKQGLGITYFVNQRWSAYFNASHEKREGARPFGGPFFFNYPFPANGGIYEIPRPIDDSTVNINGGARFVGNLWRMDFSYSGSFFRNSFNGFDYEVPFGLYPVVPGTTTPALTKGEFSYEPDNTSHQLRATLTRKLPWNGQFTVNTSLGTTRQDDNLLAPMNCQGQFGITMPVPGFLFDCADWNTTDALSRTTADLRINTQRLDARAVFQPSNAVTVRAQAKYYREDYAGTYFAYNPLTGQWGYIAENGAQGSVVPGEVGIWDGVSAVTRVRNLPLDKETREISMGADWRPDNRNTLGASFTHTAIKRAHREVATTRDNSLGLTWNNRALDWLTLRANYLYLDRSGSDYYYDPYEFTFSTDLPGFVEPAAGLSPHTVAALRKYDVASRTQHKLDLMATFVLPREMTVYASLRADRNDYDAEIGRQKYNTLGASLQWEWQPNTSTTASAWYGYDRSELGFANVNDAAGSDPALGGVTYPEANRWWMNDNQRNNYAGANLRQAIGRTMLDAAWNLTDSRGITSYRFNSPGALVSPALAATANGRFPSMTYRTNTLSLGLTIPVNQRVRMRVFDTYERGRISDWHYLGFDDTQVFDHRVYTDGGPGDYRVNMVGMTVEVAL
ncbi:MtrB/PioB family outer membrane beta-barrel protein [Thermomonas sp. HDW16]|uniref:MtrB/PioB family outer membrane beta-barrel protein n=1 Tax=Thermomonas sp. HDW16 TaxID=2714945 RepID=UPI00140D907F|nr:MtrB/PioB family outer membrane beta-barrel protein [Thermomonas sp. HDW16]QIL20749.1 MtrB/PioB family outer membrane beta-barrel protein [Thermomonas sp. HDW16]